MEKVFSIIRKTYDRKPTDDLKDLDVNAFWKILCLSHLRLQFIFDKIIHRNLRSIKNQPFKSVKQLFRRTEKLTKDQVEITSLSTIDWNKPMWRQSSLLLWESCPYYEIPNLRLGETKLNVLVGDTPSQSCGSNRRGADGIRVEIFPGFTVLGILDEIQKMMAELRCEPEQFQGRIIFMSMYNDIIWITLGNGENCMANSLNNAAYANKFPQRCGSFLGPACVKKWHGTHVNKTNAESNKTAEVMMLNFAESGHPAFRATSASERWEICKKKTEEEERNPYTSTEVKKPLNWFFALLFLSISSASTEHSQICSLNWIQIQEIKPKVRFVSLWW